MKTPLPPYLEYVQDFRINLFEFGPAGAIWHHVGGNIQRDVAPPTFREKLCSSRTGLTDIATLRRFHCGPEALEMTC